jgi:hypothetical protein
MCHEARPKGSFAKRKNPDDPARCRDCLTQARRHHKSGVETRTCRKCRESKISTDYYLDEWVWRAYHSRCIACHPSKQAAQQLRKKETNAGAIGKGHQRRADEYHETMKRICASCHISLPLTEYSLGQWFSETAISQCIQCDNEVDSVTCVTCSDTLPPSSNNCTATRCVSCQYAILTYTTNENRTCSSCQLSFASTRYSFPQWRLDDYISRCKLCEAASAANETDRVRVCSVCRESATLDQYCLSEWIKSDCEAKCNPCVKKVNSQGSAPKRRTCSFCSQSVGHHQYSLSQWLLGDTVSRCRSCETGCSLQGDTSASTPMEKSTTAHSPAQEPESTTLAHSDDPHAAPLSTLDTSKGPDIVANTNTLNVQLLRPEMQTCEILDQGHSISNQLTRAADANSAIFRICVMCHRRQDRSCYFKRTWSQARCRGCVQGARREYKRHSPNELAKFNSWLKQESTIRTCSSCHNSFKSTDHIEYSQWLAETATGSPRCAPCSQIDAPRIGKKTGRNETASRTASSEAHSLLATRAVQPSLPNQDDDECMRNDMESGSPKNDYSCPLNGESQCTAGEQACGASPNEADIPDDVPRLDMAVREVNDDEDPAIGIAVREPVPAILIDRDLRAAASTVHESSAVSDQTLVCESKMDDAAPKVNQTEMSNQCTSSAAGGVDSPATNRSHHGNLGHVNGEIPTSGLGLSSNDRPSEMLDSSITLAVDDSSADVEQTRVCIMCDQEKGKMAYNREMRSRARCSACSFTISWNCALA